MKTLILALMTLTLSAPAFAGETEFKCENHMYRDASLSLNRGEVSVKDSYMRGSQEVGAILERVLRLEGKLTVNTLTLNVRRDEGVRCDSTLAFLVDCQGSSQRALLSVDGWIYTNGMSGRLSLTIPVELKDFRLKSHLSSQGPISIGGDKPISVRLDKLNLDAGAKAILHGQEVDLAWNTFYYARESKSGSSCQKY